MDWSKLYKPAACQVKMKALDKDGVLVEIVQNLIKGGALPPELEEAALVTLREREELATTGVGMNVAIPHVKLEGLERVVCGLSVHSEGVPWDAVDGAPVHILFVVLRPDGPTEDYDPESHREMMGWIAGLGRDPDFRAFARQASKKSELTQLLKEMAPKASR